MKKEESLEEVKNEIKNCKLCGLYINRNKTVPGEGNPRADIFFIGEGPGKNEDIEGRPFVGAAGKFLDECLNIIKLSRKDVFIGNVIKCRPPMNRDPKEDEINTCQNYLFRQIKIIKPKLIVTLGRFSLSLFIPGETISKVHGKLKEVRFKKLSHPLHELGAIYVLPLYHPAAALYRGNMREMIIDDFRNIPKITKKINNKSLLGLGVKSRA